MLDVTKIPNAEKGDDKRKRMLVAKQGVAKCVGLFR